MSIGKSKGAMKDSYFHGWPLRYSKEGLELRGIHTSSSRNTMNRGQIFLNVIAYYASMLA